MNSRDFHRAFDDYRDPVFRFLWRLCRDHAEAEDLLQDTFVAFWRKGDGHDGRGPVLAYLRSIAYRLYLNQRTKRTRRASLAAARPAVAEDTPGVGASIARRDAQARLVARVRDVVDGLPDAARETFILHRFEGMDCREIGALMGLPTKTVESRLRRATRTVAAQLAPLAADVGGERA